MMITNQDCRAKGTSKLAFRRISAHALMDFFFYADFAMKVKFRSKMDSIIVQFKFEIHSSKIGSSILNYCIFFEKEHNLDDLKS